MPDRLSTPAASESPKPTRRVRGLSELTAALPEAKRVELAHKTHVRLDEGKRIGSAQQLARALVTRPELRTLRGLSAAERAVVVTLAEAQVRSAFEPATLPTALLDAAQALVERGWLFRAPEQSEANDPQAATSFVLPLAFLLQVPTWDGEEPLSLRRLLSLQGPDVCSGIVRHFGGPVLPPWALSLEQAYASLSVGAELRARVSELGDAEARLLHEICRLGGEIESSELLDLEREPLRFAGAWGVSTSRRGASFELERRALLLPLNSSRYAVPTEVHALVAAPERARATQEQQRRRERIAALKVEPLRAQFSRDPVPHVLAMALLAQQREGLRVNVGLPRSLLVSLGRALGLEADVASLFGVLGRSLGLWSAPEAFRDLGLVGQLYGKLIEAWSQGVAWDLGRVEPEVLRATGSSRALSPARDVVQALLDAVRDVGAERWVGLEELGPLVLSDPRLVNIDARMQRWSKRVGLALPEAPVVIARAIDDLFALGVLDRAEGTSKGSVSAVRMGAPARGLWFEDKTKALGSAGVHALTPLRFGLGPSAPVAAILAAGRLFEPAAMGNELQLGVSAQGIEQLALAGSTAAQMRGLLEAANVWNDSTEQLVSDATRTRVRLDFAPSMGFVWIEDEALRLRLRTEVGLASLFVDPSPHAGLLVRSGVSLERLVKACRARGVALRLLQDAGSARLVAETKRGKGGRKPRDPVG